VLISHGFFLRGGVAIGDLYMDRDIVWGSGLLRAYELESQIGGPPRLLLGSLADNSSDVTLLQQVFYQLGHYSDPRSSPHNAELLIDVSDRVVFVDYLRVAFEHEDDAGGESWDHSAIRAHRDVVEARLREYSHEPKVHAKYQWVGHYHNFRCDEYGSALEEERVDPSLLLSTSPEFSRIAKVFPSRQALVAALPWVEQGRQPPSVGSGEK
jgi:hypothetical protein